MDAKGLADLLRDYTTKRLAPLEARIEALENGRAMKFAGPHDPSLKYLAGAVVQRSGSTWVALVETTDKPGDSSSWRRIGSDR